MRRENYAYPVVFSKEKSGEIQIKAPDFPGLHTVADSEEEALQAAQEVLALFIGDMEDYGKELPKPTRIEDIKIEEGEIPVFVQVWMPYFRMKSKEVYVKKTLTIPQELNQMAMAKNINFSAVLKKGLRRELGLEE